MNARIRVLSALVTVLALCGGCLGRSDPPRFYVLTALEGSAAADSSPGPALGVGPVTLPRYLERTGIVTRRGLELDVADYDRWAEPLTDGVSRVIAANLSTLLGTKRVVVFPWPNGTPIQYQVVIDVVHLDGRLGGEVVLETRWRVLGPEKTERVHRASIVAEPIGQPGYPGLVAAMARTLARFSRGISDTVKALAPR